MFGTFNVRFDILATVLATSPNIGQIFVQFSGQSVCSEEENDPIIGAGLGTL
jgi:hypothetical protein